MIPRTNIAITDDIVKIVYRNHVGNVAERVIQPKNIWYGLSDYHRMQGRQWFMRATCLEKDSVRDFAIKDILEWEGSE